MDDVTRPAADSGRATTVGDDAADAPGPAAPLGGTIGRFAITGRLGSGGMGVVLRGHDPTLDRPVAIKLLHHAPVDGTASDDHARLLAEAQAMARLAHANVVTVYEVGVVDGRAFVAMELVEGESLADWLHAEPRSWRAIIAAFAAAGRGLDAVHAVGLVHRDFKPSNVIVGRDGRVRVVDFGLATGLAPRSEGGDLARPYATRGGQVAGTPRYMSPEQLRGDAIDARSDQFSFCVALYEALYGGVPFAGSDVTELRRALTEDRPRPPRRGVAPAAVGAAIVRGLARDPAARWPTMRDLVATLEGAAAGRRWRWAGVAAVVAVAGVVAVALVAQAVATQRPPAPVAVLATGPRTDFFVDAAARAPATGDAAFPYPSISLALAAAARSPVAARTIHVAAGTYDATREQFPLELRRGISLVGAGADATIVVGTGRVAHAAGGTALGTLDVAILVGDPTTPQTIRGVGFRPAATDDAAREPWGIYCDRGNAFPPPPAATPRPPNLVLDQIAATGFDRSIVIGTSDRPAPSGCNAVITGSLVAGTRVGVFVAGAGYGSNAPNRVQVRVGGATAADGNRLLGSRRPGRVGLNDREWPAAMMVLDQSTPVTIRHNTFSDNDVGLELNSFNPALVNDVDDNTFTGMTTAGLALSGNAHVRSLTGNYFAANNAPRDRGPARGVRSACGEDFTLAAALCIAGYGTNLPGPQIDHARGNVFAGNDVGVRIMGTPFQADVPRRVDFGTAGDPGANQFVCNSAARTPAGFDVELVAPGPTVRLAFVGNRWDHDVPTRGGATAADGTDVARPPGAVDLDAAAATTHGLPCSAPHDP